MIRLLDQRTGEQFASERLDGAMEDLFDAEDELALRVTTAIRFRIYDRELEVRPEGPLEDQSTGDLLIYAGMQLGGLRPDQYLRAREVAALVLDREPGNFMALAIEAASHMAETHYGYREPEASDREAVAAAAAARLLEKHAEIRLRDLRGWPFHDPAVWDRFVDGLRRADLPD